jgi:hypothetical protein
VKFVVEEKEHVAMKGRAYPVLFLFASCVSEILKFIWYFARLDLRSKMLTLGKSKKFFRLRSLNRIFALPGVSTTTDLPSHVVPDTAAALSLTCIPSTCWGFTPSGNGCLYFRLA